jgi:signal transduction histidine kinase/CheY-like chemotaxis protein
MAGRTMTVDVMVVMVPPLADTEDRFLITTARDITESEEIEAQLRQAQKMEAVGQLTGGIAHDFNNLLTGISGNLELLGNAIEKNRLANAGRFVASAMRSAQRAAALTHRLLAFARRQPLAPKPVDANAQLASMEDLLARTLGPDVDLNMLLLDGLWPTMCDPNQLENAILNLAINARDAMPEGGRLTLETENTEIDASYARVHGGDAEPGQYVAISVTDSGCGMTPDVIALAFEPFFTTKPTGQGTGLGLSMLYGFVKQSGGHVRIYSEPGHGTTVRLYLPRHDCPGTAAPEGHADDVTTTPPVRSGVGETVLLIEDESAIHELIAEALRDLGYAVLDAWDGPSGLDIVQSNARIDLLITDVGLPGGLNGRQVADAARVTRPGMKVLFITGFAYGAALGRGAALEVGMEIMTKPFTLDALASKVREMIPIATG